MIPMVSIEFTLGTAKDFAHHSSKMSDQKKVTVVQTVVWTMDLYANYVYSDYLGITCFFM
jgi:hypothetical protein